jgi:asparagine synthase (glutamine-hydrolysing)
LAAADAERDEGVLEPLKCLSLTGERGTEVDEGSVERLQDRTMKVVTAYQLATDLVARSEPFFYSHLPARLLDGTEGSDGARYVIGRRYRGLFDDNDGTYVTVTQAKTGEALIDRDSYGAIPIFYSTVFPIVSTDIRLLIALAKPGFDLPALAEYLSASYLSGGRTIYRNVRFLMPDETLVVKDGAATTHRKEIFPEQAPTSRKDVGYLLESAINNSIDDLLERHPGAIVLNLSGGTDSTLLLAKIRERDQRKEILTTTYFHEDWRNDLNDWEYAAEAAAAFSSHHTLVKVNNESFCRAHAELMSRAKNVFHTYPAAFYAQNKLVMGLSRDVPIINGSGPDESIIGTEKVAIGDLLSLRALKREEWIDYLIGNIDYIKMPEAIVTKMLRGTSDGFVRTRKEIAASLLGSPNFVEFQRKYHAITILQDHIQELSAAAQALDRTIVFPYLTNDIFRIIFSARFEELNSANVYKAVVKDILEKYMSRSFTHRKKIGFQSPSRPYFKSEIGLGRELARLLSTGDSAVLDLGLVGPSIRERLAADIDLHRRYDFLEWTAYNILLLEEFQRTHA